VIKNKGKRAAPAAPPITPAPIGGKEKRRVPMIPEKEKNILTNQSEQRRSEALCSIIPMTALTMANVQIKGPSRVRESRANRLTTWDHAITWLPALTEIFLPLIRAGE
jgi:hypothetical protein